MFVELTTKLTFSGKYKVIPPKILDALIKASFFNLAFLRFKSRFPKTAFNSEPLNSSSIFTIF